MVGSSCPPILWDFFNIPDNKPYRYEYHTIIQWWPLFKESLSFDMVKFFKNSPYTLLVTYSRKTLLLQKSLFFFLILQFYFHV